MKASDQLKKIQTFIENFNKEFDTNYFFQISSESEYFQACIMKRSFGRGEEEVMSLPSQYFLVEDLTASLKSYVNLLEAALLEHKKEIENGPPQLQKIVHNGIEYTYRLDD